MDFMKKKEEKSILQINTEVNVFLRHFIFSNFFNILHKIFFEHFPFTMRCLPTDKFVFCYPWHFNLTKTIMNDHELSQKKY